MKLPYLTASCKCRTTLKWLRARAHKKFSMGNKGWWPSLPLCIFTSNRRLTAVFYTNKALKVLNFSACLLFVWRNSCSAGPLECHSSPVCLFTVCVIFSSHINYELVLHCLREWMWGCQEVWKVSFAGGLEELLKIANQKKKKKSSICHNNVAERGLPPNSRFPLTAIHSCFPLAVKPLSVWNFIFENPKTKKLLWFRKRGKL